jgi:voltage-gated potassium channel
LAAKTYLSPNRGEYLRRNWFNVVIVVVPFLRPLRVVRATRPLRALRALLLGAIVARVIASVRAILNAHGLKYVLLVAGAAIAVAAALVTVFERDSGGTITDFDDGLWWALTTVTTVGYGDKFPVTADGRAVAVVLMIMGIAMFSALTASLAAFFVQPREEGPTMDDVMAKLDRLEAQIEDLRSRR